MVIDKISNREQNMFNLYNKKEEPLEEYVRFDVETYKKYRNQFSALMKTMKL